MNAEMLSHQKVQYSFGKKNNGHYSCNTSAFPTAALPSRNATLNYCIASRSVTKAHISEETPLLINHRYFDYTAINNYAKERLIIIDIDKEVLLDNDASNNEAIAASTPAFGYIKPPVKFCECRLMTILFILFAGIMMAIELLIKESQWKMGNFSLDLVDRDSWSPKLFALSGTRLLNSLNVSNIIVTHTGGVACQRSDECIAILKNMQQQRNDSAMIPYNFLIGGNGQTYEVRGWDRTSGFNTSLWQTSLVIGLIGNFTRHKPLSIQLQSAASLITESIKRKKLQASYQLYGLRNSTISPDDADGLFKNIREWKNFNSILKQ